MPKSKKIRPSVRIKEMWNILQNKNPLEDAAMLLPFAIMDYLDEQCPEFKNQVEIFYQRKKTNA